MNHTLEERLQASFEGIMIEAPEEKRIVVTAGKETVLSLLSFLKNAGYDHLGVISCVDWIAEDTLELVYILHPYWDEAGGRTAADKDCVFLKTRISRRGACCISAIPIFENAEPYERELHELFGIRFDGHPRLTPLFLEREYETPPFRKDFDTRRYVEETFESIPTIDTETDGR